jgi:predicted AAA+ superfamily ATPase
MHTIKRTASGAIHQLLLRFPCVAVLGARQVGKTTILKQVLPEAHFFDIEKRSDFERIKSDPDFFLSQQHSPIAIDEAQLLPELFPALRVAIDSDREKNGRFLISGSSSPELLKHITETLAGRIAIFELGGFSLEEQWGCEISSFYQYLKEGNITKLAALKPRFSTEQLFSSCLLGTYPEPFLKFRNDPKGFELWMENYVVTYIKRDIRNLFPSLNITAYQRFVSMLAASTGNIINVSEFARSLDVSQPTPKSYLAYIVQLPTKCDQACC